MLWVGELPESCEVWRCFEAAQEPVRQSFELLHEFKRPALSGQRRYPLAKCRNGIDHVDIGSATQVGCGRRCSSMLEVKKCELTDRLHDIAWSILRQCR